MDIILPPKPQGEQWTDEQWRAIVTNGAHTLVAAAAGSGKTTVLVERIIQKILDEQHPIDIDRLLVVTFTNAAAAEMRQRIAERIEKAIAKEPHSLHLRRQLSLLPKAAISTIHSFCLEVIRKYYYLIDLDPVFRIADETEIELIKEETIEELFEEQYGKKENDMFLSVVDRYTSDRTDIGLQTVVLSLYEFARSHPYPREWLDRLVDMYHVSANTAIEELPFAPYLLQYIEFQLQAAKQMIERALVMAEHPAGPHYLRDTLASDILQIRDLEEAKKHSWQRLHEAIHSLTWATAKRKPKNGEYDEQLVSEVKALRDKAKEKVKEIKEELFSFKPETWLHHLQEMKPVVETIVDLVKELADRLQAKKIEKGIVDFSDLEHYCLQILRHPSSTSDQLLPSDAALDYRGQFTEVLIDEYQDVNMVQEMILQLVIHDDEAAGNLFMVGDVKQSIYRFRLAEPFLFLKKYQRFSNSGGNGGILIDLAQNFRSRPEVLDGTNFVFKQIMGETVGEIVYEADAELRFGASYYPEKSMPVELVLIDKADNDHAPESENELQQDEQQELENVQLEARWIAQKIKEMIETPFYVYDRHLKQERRVMYRDIVVLLRSMPWAPQLMEEFRKQGIPVYAELSTGYFTATEVSVMLSVLKVIDNPYQDIPLASVLRSPIVGLDENELSLLRLERPKGAFYEAFLAFLEKRPATDQEAALQKKLAPFAAHLQEWRTMARQHSLAELIWSVYRATSFYDFVGTMPGGKQRQANLRFLYEKARQFEQTSFRGIFRFLRFMERMQERKDDFGAARSISEQEDVVRLMTIHKSKGLEFPIVFVAGLGKSFNTQDLRKSYLMDKDLGFAAHFVHPRLRVSYPTIAQLALKRKQELELLAEEMRILYVALTRAKEKLFLVGTVKKLENEKKRWQSVCVHSEWLLPDYIRASARCYLDWIGYSLVRHADAVCLHDGFTVENDIFAHESKWNVQAVSAAEIDREIENAEQQEAKITEQLRKGERVPLQSEWHDEIVRRMNWLYPYPLSTTSRAKQTVSELKQQRETFGAYGDEAFLKPFRTGIMDRPRFMQAKQLSSAEKGTAMHLVMQHIDLKSDITEGRIREQIAKLLQGEWLTEEQAKEIDMASILAFFQTDIGRRLQKASYVEREVPFNLALPAKETYGQWKENEETVLVQGVFDCVFQDEKGFVLIDFKTDRVQWADDVSALIEKRYRVQMELYRLAIERIWKTHVDECYIYAFDGAKLVSM
ncbi:ATP-dependent helicase/nuclease subunit A [Anoxybacillus sp. P3H1B]|uniref:helicase-exonuclease AddAB subunit AddA n=1 Tax=Anoxybacillus sp. P3H1B TaxID=1769293 RepID=UPI0007964F26|nr:helicase-exonuclease AddAB subunit AddA [Anoxybacillus sp. P3H1B]KXG10100.1 ATP-dependent helicase/nuclease subunit A [Anoxybacillus sp. P3H1B]